jgi:hypothetical protein
MRPRVLMNSTVSSAAATASLAVARSSAIADPAMLLQLQRYRQRRCWPHSNVAVASMPYPASGLADFTRSGRARGMQQQLQQQRQQQLLSRLAHSSSSVLLRSSSSGGGSLRMRAGRVLTAAAAAAAGRLYRREAGSSSSSDSSRRQRGLKPLAV